MLWVVLANLREQWFLLRKLHLWQNLDGLVLHNSGCTWLLGFSVYLLWILIRFSFQPFPFKHRCAYVLTSVSPPLLSVCDSLVRPQVSVQLSSGHVLHANGWPQLLFRHVFIAKVVDVLQIQIDALLDF